MVVLIDAKYFGNMLRNARRKQNIGANDAAKILKISLKELHRYERGLEPIPESILLSMFHHGYCLLSCRRSRYK